jgi:CRP/FNR family nitrogen fixation transcriptional regulator
MLNWKSDSGASATSSFPGSDEPGSILDGGVDLGIAGTMSLLRDFPANAEIFSQYDEVGNIYSVASGAVRFVRMMKDGRRQIGAFYFPGDIFGLAFEERHSFSAESIVKSRIQATKRTVFLERVMADKVSAHDFWSETASQLHRAQRHLWELGRKSAPERVAAFLLDTDMRLNSRGQIQLPMKREDIADYLGVNIETLSRVLTRLVRNKVIAISSARRITICNRVALRELGDS